MLHVRKYRGYKGVHGVYQLIIIYLSIIAYVFEKQTICSYSSIGVLKTAKL